MYVLETNWEFQLRLHNVISESKITCQSPDGTPNVTITTSPGTGDTVTSVLIPTNHCFWCHASLLVCLLLFGNIRYQTDQVTKIASVYNSTVLFVRDL